MLTKFEIRPVVGSPLELNTTDGSGNHLYPLKICDIQTNIDPTAIKKLGTDGEWPTFGYPGAMTINIQGTVYGVGASDAARATDYVTKRLALIDAALPPLGAQTSRKHAVLRIRMDGMTEDADADVQFGNSSIPMAALFPANSNFNITFKGFLPYFVGTGTSTKYQLG